MIDIDHTPQEGSPIKGILIGLGATFAFVGLWIAVVLLTSCTTAPLTDAQHQQIATAVSNAVHIVTDAVEQAREARRDEAGETGGEKSADPVQPAKPAESGGAPVFLYKYGGFHGEGAVEDKETQIANLHMSRSKLSYSWAKGSLRNWGLADSQADALACAFYWSPADGARIGGKFDWISTSRVTRGLENIGGYNGWKPEPFFAAPKRAFCIVSKDGRRRTNLLVTEEPK